jgi:hypothetical protein
MIEEHEVTRLDLLLIERVEHRPGGRVCRECRFLGEPVRVTEANGARRLRRACEGGGRGHTDPDWPACGAFAGIQALGCRAPAQRVDVRADKDGPSAINRNT